MSVKVNSLALGISWILRIGVLTSLTLETAGVLWNYVQTGDQSLNLTGTWQFTGGNFFDFASRTFGSMSNPNPLSVISLGIAVLMLTPYLRVIAGVIYYIVQRDWKYVGFTLFVLGVITAGLVLL